MLLVAVTVGCALSPPDGPPPPLPTPEVFGALHFGSPGLDAVQALNRRPAALVSPGAPGSPDPAASGPPSMPDAQSGAVGTPAAYSLDALAGRPDIVPLLDSLPIARSLVSAQEAFLPGYGGPFPVLRATRLDPLAASWAADATLVRANVSPEELRGGLPPPPMVCVYNPFGPPWDLVYVSESKQEALRFLVDERRILVLHLRWQRPGVDMPPPTVVPPGATPVQNWPPVSREAAREKLLAALRTPGAVGSEERARWNGFYSQPHAEPSYYPDAEPNLAPGPVYDVPETTMWRTALQQILGRWVWVFHTDAATAPVASSGTAPYGVLCTTVPGTPRLVTEPAAFGMVDATTGQVIRFTRPVRRLVRTPG
ncbi:hypothetical protein D3C72_385910 [compost metagenome]